MLLADIVGQERAVATLSRAVAAGRVAHACLFDGPESVGKRSAAIGLALALCCAERPGRGCGTCDTCRRILAGRHPDVLTFAPETSQYKVEQAREVVALAATRPHEAPARVLIFDSADCLNPSSANCLLKTLEEPFPGNHLVLVTAAPDRLLPTLRSRTQRVRFVALSPAALVRAGAVPGGHGRAGGNRGGAGRRAGGATGSWPWPPRPSRACGPSSRTCARPRRRRAWAPIFDAAGEFSDKESRQDLPEALGLLARLYRDALVRAAGADDLVFLRDRAGDIDLLAKRAQKDYDLRVLRACPARSGRGFERAPRPT